MRPVNKSGAAPIGVGRPRGTDRATVGANGTLQARSARMPASPPLTAPPNPRRAAMSTTNTIDVPAEHMPVLLTTAAREVALIADDLTHSERDGTMSPHIERIETAIAAFRDVLSGSPLQASTVHSLAIAQIDWECGDTDVRLPADADELAEFTARLERQSFLIAVRDGVTL